MTAAAELSRDAAGRPTSRSQKKAKGEVLRHHCPPLSTGRGGTRATVSLRELDRALGGDDDGIL